MRHLILCVLLALPVFSFGWVCPNNFQQISVGDTLKEIQAKCGKPVSELKEEKQPNLPQEWKYFINVTQPFQTTYTPSVGAPNQGTIKMTVTFVNDRAINITVQDQSLTSTSLCGPTINTGDNQDSIKSSCGKPVFIQKQESDVPPIEIIEYKYNTTPPNTLIFENGVLKYRK